jgi:hypothetical protein
MDHSWRKDRSQSRKENEGGAKKNKPDIEMARWSTLKNMETMESGNEEKRTTIHLQEQNGLETSRPRNAQALAWESKEAQNYPRKLGKIKRERPAKK